MRKLFAIGIAAALALSTGVVVFAESSEKTIGGNESQSINVIAKRTDTTENNVVYSVDMKWDDMTFTYHEKSTRVWNPTDHTYSEKIIGGWDKNTADILVTNHSNANVGYTLSCEVDSKYSDDFYLGTSKDSMLGSTTGTLNTAENTAVDNAPSTQLTIYPGGSLPAGTNDANVATLTITIGAK